MKNIKLTELMHLYVEQSTLVSPDNFNSFETFVNSMDLGFVIWMDPVEQRLDITVSDYNKFLISKLKYSL